MKRYIIALLIVLLPSVVDAKEWRLIVDAGEYTREDCVVSVEIADLKSPKKQIPKLYETTDGKRQFVESQISESECGTQLLSWIIDGQLPKGGKRTYSLMLEKSDKPAPAMAVEDNSKTIVLKRDGQPILAYNYTMSSLSEGVGEEFSRSGYIHPIYSPKGNVLTNIQPVDHKHHYGLWNPWTRLEYDSVVYDLWNLGSKKGTVRAVAIEEQFEGLVSSGYKASLEHVVFTPEAETVVMDESWSVTAWNTKEGYLWDFESNLEAATSLPLVMKEYRYAGFAMRATDEWTKDNCDMYTSEGKTRPYIDGTNARWIYVTGQCKGGRSGVLFMGNPDNFNAPQPLRIWDQNANHGRGDAFINFAPTKDRDWTISPGKKERLKYRLFVYDGEMTPNRAEALWQDYAQPPVVTINRVK